MRGLMFGLPDFMLSADQLKASAFNLNPDLI